MMPSSSSISSCSCTYCTVTPTAVATVTAATNGRHLSSSGYPPLPLSPLPLLLPLGDDDPPLLVLVLVLVVVVGVCPPWMATALNLCLDLDRGHPIPHSMLVWNDGRINTSTPLPRIHLHLCPVSIVCRMYCRMGTTVPSSPQNRTLPHLFHSTIVITPHLA